MPTFPVRDVPATDHAMCERWPRRSDKGNKLFAYQNYVPIRPVKCYGTWVTQSFRLKFIDCLEQSDAGSYHTRDIVSDFKIARRCLTGNIILHCGLSVGPIWPGQWLLRPYCGKFWINFMKNEESWSNSLLLFICSPTHNVSGHAHKQPSCTKPLPRGISASTINLIWQIFASKISDCSTLRCSTMYFNFYRWK